MSEASPRLFRAEEVHAGKPIGVFYFDFNQGPAQPDFDLAGYLQKNVVFTLFNPTPTEYLRAMDRDGPGATESPYTVDAGHFQVEMTLVDYTYDRESFDGMTKRFEA